MRRFYNFISVMFEDFSFIKIELIENDSLEVCLPDGEILVWFKDNVKNAYKILMGIYRSCVNDTLYDYYCLYC